MPTLDLTADRQTAIDAFNVSRETLGRLDLIAQQLLIWQARMNLVAPSTLPVLWTRHILDSLQLVDLVPSARKWVDLGSGGGFPGLVVAAVLAEAGGHVHLVESNHRKSAFLREAGRIAGLPVTVHARRIDDFAAGFDDDCDVVSARALAPLVDLITYAAPFLEKGAQGLFPKGQDVDAELTEAARYWHIEADMLSSITDPAGRIVRVRQARRLTVGR